MLFYLLLLARALGTLFFVNLQIERIQNPALWRRYQAYKKIMDEKNGNVINEKQLFHGTEFGSLAQLNSNGFNRSYAGKNGKRWGLGIATQTTQTPISVK